MARNQHQFYPSYQHQDFFDQPSPQYYTSQFYPYQQYYYENSPPAQAPAPAPAPRGRGRGSGRGRGGRRYHNYPQPGANSQHYQSESNSFVNPYHQNSALPELNGNHDSGRQIGADNRRRGKRGQPAIFDQSPVDNNAENLGAVGGTTRVKNKKQNYGYRKQIPSKKHGNVGKEEKLTDIDQEKETLVEKKTPQLRPNGRFAYGYKKNPGDEVENDETQRGRLIEELSANSYECMVCCEMIWRDVAVWSCGVCYHIFHLRCIKKWARSAAASEAQTDVTGWRCPSCQNVSSTMPTHYRCFCGKAQNPQYHHHEIPHSCGAVCRKAGPKPCTHSCTILCHPGPCPPCNANVVQTCQCGQTKQTVRCGQSSSLQCGKQCEKTLNCGKHQCTQICHSGQCEPCDVTIDQACFCSQEKREIVCGSKESFSSSYSCDKPCDRMLLCGNHKCSSVCHPGQCSECEFLPDAVVSCPCGKKALNDITNHIRKSCLDAVATCGEICNKPLQCGPADKPHRCLSKCHPGPCGACSDTTEVTCRCGYNTDLLPCSKIVEFTAKNPFTCQRKCNKKLSCGRHKCQNRCCVEEDHKCMQLCGRYLSCKLHRCEETCHNGQCPTCWHVSFDDLTCECGAEVTIAPVACGTKPPECKQPCIRSHVCDHKVLHNCHSEERCPPCTVLTEKWCHGKHEMRRNIPCHIAELSCGRPCGNDLPCNQHKCIKNCHKGDCTQGNGQCLQPCVAERAECGHPCGVPCHSGQACPPSACKVLVEYKCECGNRVEKMPCNSRNQSKMDTNDNCQFPSLATSVLAMKIASAQEGQTVDISSLAKLDRKIECNSSCAVLERNRQLALALQIKNPDLSGKLSTTQYNQFLKDYAKQHTSFVSSIEGTLHKLVETAQRSKHLHRSHAFAPMKSIQRKFIHELAEFYGCETQSYDEEPNKNVVATAVRGKCWLPNRSLTQMTQREVHGKAPMPIPHGVSSDQIRSAAAAANQSTKLIGPSKIKPPPKRAWAAPTPPPQKGDQPPIDYFDMTD